MNAAVFSSPFEDRVTSFTLLLARAMAKLTSCKVHKIKCNLFLEIISACAFLTSRAGPDSETDA